MHWFSLSLQPLHRSCKPQKAATSEPMMRRALRDLKHLIKTGQHGPGQSRRKTSNALPMVFGCEGSAQLSEGKK